MLPYTSWNMIHTHSGNTIGCRGRATHGGRKTGCVVLFCRHLTIMDVGPTHPPAPAIIITLFHFIMFIPPTNHQRSRVINIHQKTSRNKSHTSHDQSRTSHTSHVQKTGLEKQDHQKTFQEALPTPPTIIRPGLGATGASGGGPVVR